jgi:repressor LexA
MTEKKLTTRQKQILKFISEFIENNKFPPTRSELAAHFGFRSPNAAESHLRALESKSVIAIERGAARGITLLPLAADELPSMSMRDAGIFDGDLLAVHRTPEARNGQIVVARVDDEVTVKRFHRRDFRVRLLPENADFQPIEIDLRHQDLVIEGLGVGVIRPQL